MNSEPTQTIPSVIIALSLASVPNNKRSMIEIGLSLSIELGDMYKQYAIYANEPSNNSSTNKCPKISIVRESLLMFAKLALSFVMIFVNVLIYFAPFIIA